MWSKNYERLWALIKGHGEIAVCMVWRDLDLPEEERRPPKLAFAHYGESWVIWGDSNYASYNPKFDGHCEREAFLKDCRTLNLEWVYAPEGVSEAYAQKSN